jgi:hypothetical protein
VLPKTPSGKVELESAVLGTRYGAALPTYRPLESGFPLTLITPASDKAHHVDFRRLGGQ